MFDDGLSIGKYFGVEVRLSSYWLMFMGLILILNFQAFSIYMWLFLIVLLHEYGHVLAAKFLGHEVRNIILHPMGGVANIVVPKKATEELIITFAGPAVNVLLIPVFYYMSYLGPFFVYISFVNAMILVFNLLPTFPMDGGRVLRAILVMTLRRRYLATLIAVRLSQIICLMGFLYGIYSVNIMLSIVSVLIAMMASNELDVEKEYENETLGAK